MLIFSISESETQTRKKKKMETIADQNQYLLGDIQEKLKAKAKEYGMDEYTWMEAWQNAEQTAMETDNFKRYIKDGYSWIEIFEIIAFESLDNL